MPSQANDDIYVNAGDSFDTTYYPDPKVNEEIEETEQVKQGNRAASYPVMDEVADWFKREVEEAPDIFNIDPDNGFSIEAQVYGLQLYQKKMIEKAHEFDEWGEGKA